MLFDNDMTEEEMNRFEQCIPIILEMEGGLVDNPRDPGGITKYGVSLRAYKKQYPAATKETIKNLSVDEAKRFYQTFYWYDSCADQFPPAIALMVFDTAINCGTKTAKKILQRALKVKDDGIVGENTISALKVANMKDLIISFTTKRNLYYISISTPAESDSEKEKQNKKNRKTFLEGWLNRSGKIMAKAILMESKNG